MLFRITEVIDGYYGSQLNIGLELVWRLISELIGCNQSI